MTPGRGHRSDGNPPARIGLLFSLASTLIGLLCLECVLRSDLADGLWNRPYGPEEIQWLVTDPILGWANQPLFENERVRIDERGFRGTPLRAEKRAGVPRIAFLGDSGTFGFQKTAPEKIKVYGFADALAARLQTQGGGEVEILNAGVIGYNSSQGLRQLQTRILRLRPDVVVVRFGFNDLSVAHDPGRRIAEPESRVARALLYRFSDSGLLRLWLRAWRQLPVHGEPRAMRWVELDRFEANLRRFAELAATHDFHLLLMDYPLRDPARHIQIMQSPQRLRWMVGVKSLEEFHRIHTEYQRALARVAGDVGAPLLLTAPVCRAAEPPCFGDQDFAHPDTNGAHLIAGLLHEELEGRGWLKARSAE